MTKIDLDTLEAIHAKATPGEWSYTLNPEGTRWILDSAPAHGIACGAGYEPTTLANANAIVAAHNALPALIARVRELEGALEWIAENPSEDVAGYARNILAEQEPQP